MNKSELREIVFVIQYHKLGMRDTAARALSALIRSARTKRSSTALWEYATMLQLDTHPNFIV